MGEGSKYAIHLLYYWGTDNGKLSDNHESPVLPGGFQRLMYISSSCLPTLSNQQPKQSARFECSSLTSADLQTNAH